LPDITARSPSDPAGPICTVPISVRSTVSTNANVADRRNQCLVTKDGQRFLVNLSAEDENPAPITIVMNWDAAPRK
jgi:hypothetical protein